MTEATVSTDSFSSGDLPVKSSKKLEKEQEEEKQPEINGPVILQSKEEARKPRTSSFQQPKVFDDGTNTFFWRAHTLSVLFCMIVGFVYVALLEDVKIDSSYNTKRGLLACLTVFCLFGMTQAKDGPFYRPHPAFWRLVLCVSVVYQLLLVFILFQSVDDARKLMNYMDSSLGKPLPEQSYSEDCRIYDSLNLDPFHNFKEKMDIFVFAHIAGWYVKMLMIRDRWLCLILSLLFELLEYSLEHQLPNFAECWWDHWVLDFLVCNGLGIYFGYLTLNYLNMKHYNWRGLWNISSYKGKLKRIAAQFTPYSWTKFEWHPTSSLTRWLGVIGIIFMWELSELNTFYLKFVLWVPPPHYLNVVRLCLYCPAGAVALMETYQYMADPACEKFGQQAWIMAAIITTELLVVLKFDFAMVSQPLPFHIAICWVVALVALTLWTLYHFVFIPLLQHLQTHRQPLARELEKSKTCSEGTDNHLVSATEGLEVGANGSDIVTPLSGRSNIGQRKAKTAELRAT